MKIISITLPDIKYGEIKPEEDSFIARDKVFVVADGITRDPLKPLDFGKLSMKRLLDSYPIPSPAKMAADSFCHSFLKHVVKRKNNIETVKTGFKFANDQIKKINDRLNPNPDYLINDYYGCVACAGIIGKNIIHWGFVGDCGLAIFDLGGKLKFRTPDGLQNFEEYIDKHPNYWRKPERRKYIRSEFRNNPNQIKDGRLVGYGALTGEESAQVFFQFGSNKIEKNDLIVLYTDGFAKSIEESAFYATLMHSFENDKLFMDFDLTLSQRDYIKYGRERTLAAIFMN